MTSDSSSEISVISAVRIFLSVSTNEVQLAWPTYHCKSHSKNGQSGPAPPWNPEGKSSSSRKGGIYESGGEFELENREFLLFPTYLHQNLKMLKGEAHAGFEARTAEPNEVRISEAGVVTDIIAQWRTGRRWMRWRTSISGRRR